MIYMVSLRIALLPHSNEMISDYNNCFIFI